MRISFCLIVAALVLPLAVAPAAEVSGKADGEAKVIERETQEVHGWTVRVDVRLLPGGELHEKFGRTAMDLLRADLTRIAVLMPEKQLAAMRKVVIVVDEHPVLKGAQYHPNKGWLIDNGHEASLAKCVHVSRASTYANPDHVFVQPSMMLHELAHAYHDQVLDFEYKPVKAAFARAQLEGQYKEVLFVKGGKRKHYALTNHKEYFAEATEAWFGTNDFYPFVRSELKEHDAGLYKVLEEVWGSEG